MKVPVALFAAMVRASRLACPPREWQHARRVQARALQPDQVGGPSFAGGKPAAARLRSRRHPRENPARRRQHRVTTPTQARPPARPPPPTPPPPPPPPPPPHPPTHSTTTRQHTERHSVGDEQQDSPGDRI